MRFFLSTTLSVSLTLGALPVLVVDAAVQDAAAEQVVAQAEPAEAASGPAEKRAWVVAAAQAGFEAEGLVGAAVAQAGLAGLAEKRASAAQVEEWAVVVVPAASEVVALALLRQDGSAVVVSDSPEPA
jgi:hypothetical protein